MASETLEQQLVARVEEYRRELEVALAELEEAQQHVARLRNTLDGYDAVLAAERIRLGKAPIETTQGECEVGTEPTAQWAIEDMTVPELVVAVLREAGGPLRSKEIVDRMVAKGWDSEAKNPPQVVRGALYREAKKAEGLFAQIGRSRFALREWMQQGLVQQKPMREP